MLFRSAVLRYLIAAAVFVSLVLMPVGSQWLFGVRFDTTFLIILAMVACAWYLGRGPGLLIAFLFEAALIYFAAPGFTVRAVFVTLNRLLLFTGVVWFASSRRAAENRLRDQKELLEVTLASIGDAVIATDTNGCVTFVNPVAAQLTGWEASDALRKPLDQILRLFDEDSGEAVAGPFDQIKRDGTVVSLANHTMLVTKAGDLIPIEDSGAPIKDAEGNLVGAVIVFHDVTEKRAVQAEREKLLVSERGARIEAERANRLKDDFLAIVSHELRTPLNAILGWSNILRMTHDKGEDVLNGLEIIERNARSQNKIIGDILDVSRIASDKLVVDLQPVDLSSVILEVNDSLQPTAHARNIRLTATLSDKQAIVSGDIHRLRQVFSNLVSNAIKFTPDGGSVHIELTHDNRNATVRIVDNGIGIKPELLDEIFDRFRQVDSSIKRERGGLGLGLAIVRHLVELHHGKVVAASEGEGAGSVFTVSLPLIVAEPIEPITPPARLPGEASIASVKVLIVDDDDDTLEGFCFSLNRLGAETRTANSAAHALEVLKNWRPDILISDLGMPGEDGFQLIAKVRELDRESGGRLPAAAITAYAGTEYRDRAIEAGFDAHVTKPIDPAELATLIDRLRQMK